MAQDNELKLLCSTGTRGKRKPLVAQRGDEVLHADTIDLFCASAREKFRDTLMEKIPGLNQADVEKELLRLASLAEKPKPTSESDSQSEVAALLDEMPQDIRDEADAMLADRQLIKRIVDDIANLNVAGEKELTATLYLVGVSRLLDHPLAAIIQGPSSSGKSYLIERTARLFPPEVVIHATQMTPQSFFHMRPGSLVHRFVVAGERSRSEDDEQADATRALREMLSAGKLTKLMPVKVDGGRIETVQIEQDGPIAYVESTTLAKVFDEDANRCVMMHTDERPEQTRRIVKQLAAAYSGNERVGTRERIIFRHHALQRMLQQMPVVVPYAGQLGELIVSDRVEVRRAFPHLIGMVQAVTLLHQRQRELDGDGALVATPEDYQLARYLLLKPMARLLGSVIPDPARRFHERLRAWVIGEFTTTEAKRRETSSKSAVSGWMAELHDAGLIEMVQAARGRTPSTWRLADHAQQADAGSLPAVRDLFPESAWTHGREEQMA